MKPEQNLILIGMSGAGKSTLGVLLAKALGKQFVDTDLLIQQKTGKLLQEILDTEGIDRFLEIEEEVLSSLDMTQSVISTGGSAVYSEKAMRHLKKGGVTLHLHVDYPALTKRLHNLSTRGIVFKGQSDLRGVYEDRLRLYLAYADLTVDCTHNSVDDSVDQILQALSQKHGD
jgi:shikimate kinase